MNYQSPQPSMIASTTISDEPILLSSDNLKRNCKPKIAETKDSYNNEGLKAGTTAIDFTLKDITGNEVMLSNLLEEKPVVMILGSYT